MAKILTKGLIGMQDLNTGSGTFARATSTGGTQNLTQIGLSANGTVWVGSEFAANYGTSDIGAQINAAYLALPASGGTIYVAAQPSGAPYGFVTPIVFAVAGKYVSLKGARPSTQSGNAGTTGTMNGVTLNFTPQTSSTTFTLTGVANAVSGSTAVYSGTITGGGSNAFKGKVFYIAGYVTNSVNNGYFVCTASTGSTLTLANGRAIAESHSSTAALLSQTAITWDTEPSVGDGFNPAQVFSDITLVNNYDNAVTGTGALTQGGTGSCSIGIDFSGSSRLSCVNARIAGFGVGKLSNSPGNSWGATDFNMSCAWCGVGQYFHDGFEGYGHFGGVYADNNIGFQLSGVSNFEVDLGFYKISFDSNILNGSATYNGAVAMTLFAGCHWEDLGGGAATWIYCSNGDVTISGGAMLDNTATGSVTYWVYMDNARRIDVVGLNVFSAGRTATQVFQLNGSATGFFSGSNSSTTPLSTLIGGSPGVYANFFSGNTVPTITSIIQTNGLKQGSSITLSTSAQQVGIPTASSMFLLRESVTGGTALVLVDNTSTSVVIVSTAGAFAAWTVTASPTSNQIGLSYSSSALQITGGSTIGGSAPTIFYTQIATQ